MVEKELAKPNPQNSERHSEKPNFDEECSRWDVDDDDSEDAALGLDFSKQAEEDGLDNGWQGSSATEMRRRDRIAERHIAKTYRQARAYAEEYIQAYLKGDQANYVRRIVNETRWQRRRRFDMAGIEWYKSPDSHVEELFFNNSYDFEFWHAWHQSTPAQRSQWMVYCSKRDSTFRDYWLFAVGYVDARLARSSESDRAVANMLIDTLRGRVRWDLTSHPPGFGRGKLKGAMKSLDDLIAGFSDGRPYDKNAWRVMAEAALTVDEMLEPYVFNLFG